MNFDLAIDFSFTFNSDSQSNSHSHKLCQTLCVYCSCIVLNLLGLNVFALSLISALHFNCDFSLFIESWKLAT